MDINENSIRERAHWLWKQAGSPEGRDLEFWLEAEQGLREEGSQADFKPHEDEDKVSNPDSFSPTPWGAQG
jgi:hypothetical protein